MLRTHLYGEFVTPFVVTCNHVVCRWTLCHAKFRYAGVYRTYVHNQPFIFRVMRSMMVRVNR